MIEKVTPLYGGLPPAGAASEINNGCVSLLRDALAKALTGEIQHVAVVYADKDGDTGGSYDGKPATLLFALARMGRRIHDGVDKREKGL